MRQLLPLALTLLAVSGCYRDLDVPDCAHEPGGCVSPDAEADGENADASDTAESE